MVILDLWGISFHPAVVVGIGNDLLFNSILAHCAFKCEQFKIRLWYYSHAVHAKNRHQASESYVRCLKVLCCYKFDHISCMRLSHKYRKWLLLPRGDNQGISEFRSNFGIPIFRV